MLRPTRGGSSLLSQLCQARQSAPAPQHCSLLQKPAVQPARGLASSPSPTSASTRSSWTTLLAVGLVGVGAYAAGSLYPPALVTMVHPREAPAAPGVDSEEGKAHTSSIESRLFELPQVKALLSARSHVPVEARSEDTPDAEAGRIPGANPSTVVPSLNVSPGHEPHYVASRPYRNYPPSKLLHSLTAGTLRGPGRFAVPPLVLAKTEAGAKAEGGHAGDCHIFIHVGRSLCGHDGIVHGGLLATICDEALARTAFVSLPAKVGVTAKLEVQYKAPTMADQFIVVKTRLVEARGRKVDVEGVIEDLQGTRLVEAKALFVQPKFAQFLDTSLVKSALDIDPAAPPPTKH
ncbi:unnamed protein product [Parajaminaea phylloscopi]